MYRESLVMGLALSVLVCTAQGAVLTPISPAPTGAKIGVTHDAESGNYVITYEAEDELHPKGLYQTIYIPATKIDPSIKSRFVQAGPANSIAYRYQIMNGKKSRQNLELIVAAVTSVNGSLTSPAGWDVSDVNDSEGGRRIGWSYAGHEDLGGLAPGKTLVGFAFNSNDLPGVSEIQFSGAAPIHAYAGDGPNYEITEQVSNLDENNFVLRFAAVPKISVPNPFDAATVLGEIQHHIDQNLIAMKLIDPAFVAQLDRLIQAAVDAAKLNNKAAVRGEIKDLRKLLQEQHDDLDKEDGADFGKERGDKDRDDKDKLRPRLIDKLAAKVLDFDLRYVEQRIKDKNGKDKDD